MDEIYFYICSDKLIHRLRIITEENIFNSLLWITEKGFTQGLITSTESDEADKMKMWEVEIKRALGKGDRAV